MELSVRNGKLLYSTSSIFIPPDCEKFLCLGCLTPPSLPHPPTWPLCGWCSIMSVGEAMVCLSGPEGLPTHSCKEKATRPESYPPLLFSNISFKVSTAVVLRLHSTALFFCSRKPLNAHRRLGRTKAGLQAIRRSSSIMQMF